MLPWGANAQKGTFLTPSPHGGEAGDTGKAGHDLSNDEASLEEGLSQMGAPAKMPFRFPQCSQSQSE